MTTALGGGTIPAERAYLDTEIMPCLGPDVRWLGELDFDGKTALLGRAACLVFPARWDEPFGLVLVEAMACGTPVAALAAGAVPELVADGETGILCREPAALGAAIDRAARLDPARCRARAERLFSAGRMVTDYENVYRRLISAPGSRPPGAGTGPARSG